MGKKSEGLSRQVGDVSRCTDGVENGLRDAEDTVDGMQEEIDTLQEMLHSLTQAPM